jgi:hypothetical protein
MSGKIVQRLAGIGGLRPPIPNEVTFATVKAKAFSLLQPERFPAVFAYMRSIEFDQTGFERAYYAKLSTTIKRNLRQLFTDLTFADRVEDAPLLAAVLFLQGE